MATKVDQNAVVAQFLGRIKAGGAIFPEDADRIAAQLGLQDEVAASAGSDKVFEWVDSSTRTDKIRLEVPEHLASGETAAAEVDTTVVTGTHPGGTGSNDPAVNPGATGGEPFSGDVQGVGFSGQVVDPGSYKPEDKAEETKGSKSGK